MRTNRMHHAGLPSFYKVESMVLLIGSGTMAVEYAKVLDAQAKKLIVVGRGKDSASEFEKKTGHSVMTGGVDLAIENGRIKNISTAIVCVGVESLQEVTIKLIQQGVKKILVEKPGVLNLGQIKPLIELASKNQSEVYIAYNRRFLSSVKKAMKIIAEDGGIRSFTFDFTEWGHEIENLKKPQVVKENWVLANSSHVLDLAFYLGGMPEKLNADHSGAVAWHKTAAIFVGSGKTDKGSLFSYHANWGAPGRWGLEFCTDNHKLILRPMEKLHVMKKNTIKIDEVEVEEEDRILDEKFKPGLYRMVEEFFLKKSQELCSLEQLQINMNYFGKIGNYHNKQISLDVKRN